MARMIVVDFTGVEGGGFVRVPQGDYHLRLKKLVGKKSSEGNKYLAATFEIAAGKKKGSSLAPHNFSLLKQSLWNLRNFLEAAGKTVKSKATNIDLDKMIGLECAATLVDGEPYEGKIKSIISAFFPLEDLGSTSDGEDLEDSLEEPEEGEESAEEEEAEPAPKKPAKKPAKKVVEEEEPEEEAEAEEEPEEEEAPKKKPAKKAKKAEEEEEEEDLFS